MDPFRGSRARRFGRDLEPRMVGKLEALSREGWTVGWEPRLGAHLLVGPGGRFLLTQERRAIPTLDQTVTIVVVWGAFPEEVADRGDGVFEVHGDALLAFLRGQADLLGDYEISGD